MKFGFLKQAHMKAAMWLPESVYISEEEPDGVAKSNPYNNIDLCIISK